MNPCKEISACSIHRQLDSIAEQVAAELLLQYHNDEQEATNSSLGGDEMDTSTVGQSACDEAAPREDGATDTAITSDKLKRLGLPTEVVLDGINTVLYSRLHFSAPSMDQYYDLENSFIDKVCCIFVYYVESAKWSTFLINSRCWHGRKVYPSLCALCTRQWQEG